MEQVEKVNTKVWAKADLDGEEDAKSKKKKKRS